MSVDRLMNPLSAGATIGKSGSDAGFSYCGERMGKIVKVGGKRKFMASQPKMIPLPKAKGKNDITPEKLEELKKKYYLGGGIVTRV